MSKYIIELDDRIKLVTSVGVTENGVVYTTSDYVHNLEELNSDYINEHFGQLQDEAYQRGLEDAWEAARKIAQEWEEDSDTEHRVVIDDSIRITLDSMTASGAIAKLKVYEEHKDDSIKVGDEVSTRDGAPSHTFLVTKVTKNNVYGIGDEGSWNYYTKDEVTKTGKHYDIQSILEAMRE